MKSTLVFFGSGPVAAASLRLLSNSFDIEAVITKPSTQREMAIACPDTPVITANTRTELDEVIRQERFSSRIAVLIDFGIIVSQDTIDSFELGIVNSHFSLLPELRGADPISFALLEGKQDTGVSLMLVVEAMDEGPLIGQSAITIQPKETTPSLTENLIHTSYDLLKNNLDDYIKGDISPYSQEEAQKSNKKEITYTRKLQKQDGEIDWTKPAEIIEREVRAYCEWPKSYTNIGGLDLVIVNAEVVDINGTPGTPFVYEKQLAVYCGEKAQLIKKLKPAGKQLMDSQSFLAGYKKRIGL